MTKLKDIRHPNIVSLLGVIEDETMSALILEFGNQSEVLRSYDGGDLRPTEGLIGLGPREFAKQLAATVSVLHEHGVAFCCPRTRQCRCAVNTLCSFG